MEYKGNTDSRLLKAYSAIDSEQVDVLSLDIFDTLLWRKVPDPKDLFLILGKKLQEAGWLIPAVTPEGFAKLRITAEKIARQEKEFKQGTGEVTLTEIYWHLQGVFRKLTLQEMLSTNIKGIYESEVTEVVNIELFLEKKLLVFDHNILNLFSYAQRKSIPVILVSDTYFEEWQLEKLLLPLTGFFMLFSSCDYSCSKKNGLFACVRKKMSTAEQKHLLHIGDNQESDILSAKEAGFDTIFYQKSEEKLETIIKHEWPDLTKRRHYLDDHQGDYGLTALREKTIQGTAQLELKTEDRFFWRYGASILGPILLGFVHWIYERCYQMNEKNVFCLMREGNLYAKLIRLFAPYFKKHTVDTKELWISRPFIAHAAIGSASQIEVVTVLNTFLEHFTLDYFCSYLGIDIKKTDKWSAYQHVRMEDPDLRKSFIRFLISHKSLRYQMIQSASAKRRRYLHYLGTMIDLSSDLPMTLVDSGWNGTTQICLQQVLNLENFSKRLHGLYLGTTESAQDVLLNDIVTEGYLFKGGYPDCSNAHRKGCFVLEQTATAPTRMGPLFDITENGTISTYPFLIPERQSRQAEIVQQGIFAFFEEAGRYINKGAIALDAESSALQNQLRAILLRSMINTAQTEASRFGSWLHEHGPSPNATQMIGKNTFYERFIKDMLPLAALKESNLNWPAAYAAKQSPYLTLTSQAIWLKTLHPRCFLSEDGFSLKIFIDTGKNFSKKAHRTFTLRSNPNRHFFTAAKLFSTKKGIKRMQLTFNFPPSLVRFKSLRISAYNRTTPKPTYVYLFETSSTDNFAEKLPFSTFECSVGKQIDFNTFYCEDTLSLIYTFENANTYLVRVQMCCEMFAWQKNMQGLQSFAD